MAIATAALINLGIQGAIAGVQYYQGREKQKEADLAAQRAAAKLAGIEEADEVSSLQVPTLGAELARQELGQQFATSVAAAQSAGAAGVLGGIPSLANLGADKALDIAAQLDALEKQRDQFVAQQLQARATREVAAERQLVGMELAGAQQASAAARMQQQQAGIGFAQGAGETAAAYIKAQPLYELSRDAAEKAAISEAKTAMEESLTKAPKPPVLDISSPLVESELIQPPSMPEPTVDTQQIKRNPLTSGYEGLLEMGMRVGREMSPKTQGMSYLFQPPIGLGG